MTRWKIVPAGLVLALTLVACGGHSDRNQNPTTAPQARAAVVQTAGGCPMKGGQCEMKAGVCDKAGTCDKAGKCEMKNGTCDKAGKCDMKNGTCDKAGKCDMKAGACPMNKGQSGTK